MNNKHSHTRSHNVTISRHLETLLNQPYFIRKSSTAFINNNMQPLDSTLPVGELNVSSSDYLPICRLHRWSSVRAECSLRSWEYRSARSKLDPGARNNKPSAQAKQTSVRYLAKQMQSNSQARYRCSRGCSVSSKIGWRAERAARCAIFNERAFDVERSRTEVTKHVATLVRRVEIG